jgi:thioesterase domain-containing protein
MAAAARLHGRPPSVDAEEIRAVDPARRLEWSLEHLLAAGMLPPAGREHTRRVFRIHLGALGVLRRYVPRVYPGRITMFRASEEDPWLHTLVRHPGRGSRELWWGWQALTSEPLVVVDVPGSHSTMMSEPRVQVLASRLTECLDEAEDRT